MSIIYTHSVDVYRSTHIHEQISKKCELGMAIFSATVLCNLMTITLQRRYNNASEALYSMNKLLAHGAVQYHKHKETNIKISTMR